MEKNSGTVAEKKILDAALKIFSHRGFFGTRMQEIADEAGINKAMLHYYFRNKDKIFESVFNLAFKSANDRVISILFENIDLESKIRKFCEAYIDIIMEYPALPAFIIHEMNHNQEHLKNCLRKIKWKMPEAFLKQVEQEIGKGNIMKMDPGQLIVNLFSLCVFPFLAKPMLKFNLNLNEEEFHEFVLKRKELIPQFVINSIKIK